MNVPKLANWFLAYLLYVTAGQAAAKELMFNSSQQQMQVFELFTSEGCSSCPPAERWFNDLEKQSGLWRDFIPIVFHVDYWNYLGWTDPLSSARYAERQRAYAKSWNQKSVYTPGVVKNSLEWKAWRGLKKVSGARSDVVGELKVKGTDQVFSATFAPQGSFATGETLDLHSAVLLMGFKSKVTTGENSGETLLHQFSVCSYSSIVMSKEGFNYIASVKPDSCRKYKGVEKAVVFWVSKKNKPAILQATGGMWR